MIAPSVRQRMEPEREEADTRHCDRGLEQVGHRDGCERRKPPHCPAAL